MPTGRALTTRIAAPIRNAPTPMTRRRRVSAADRPAATVDWSMLTIGGLLVLWMLIVIGRLVQLQVYQAETLREKAEQQQQKTFRTTPARGTILDRQGRELATSLKVASVYVAPQNIRPEEDRRKLAATLAAVLGLDADKVLEKLTSKRPFVALKRKVSPEEEKAIQNLGLPGVELVTEMQRHYPQGLVGASVIGFVGLSEDEVEERGKAGVERAFEQHLLGRPGRVIVEQDARRKVFNVLETAPEVGQSLILTLDAQIQFEVERILTEALREQGQGRGDCRSRTGDGRSPGAGLFLWRPAPRTTPRRRGAAAPVSQPGRDGPLRTRLGLQNRHLRRGLRGKAPDAPAED